MARQKSTFSVPLQTDILSGGNVGLSFGNGPLPVGDLSISIFFPQIRRQMSLGTYL